MEKLVALPIRKESKDPDALGDEWLKLMAHKGVGRNIMNLRIEDYKRMQTLAVELCQECYSYIQDRWNNLTPKLQRNLI